MSYKLAPHPSLSPAEEEGRVRVDRPLFNRIHLDMELLELRRIDRGGRLGHQALGLLCLRKGDDISNGTRAAQQHDQPVESERDPAVWRGTVLKSIQQEAKLCRRFILADPKQVEDFALYLTLVNTDAAPTDFVPIQDHVICFGAHLHRIGLK
jgi:hypothetical protein